MKSQCITIDMLSDYLDGCLSDKDRDKAEEHFSVCDRCREELISDYRVLKECNLLRRKPVSEEDTRPRLNHPGRLKKIYKWIAHTFTPDIPPGMGFSPVRKYGKISSADYAEFSVSVGELQAEMHIEKTGKEKATIRVAVLKEKTRLKNIRLIFERDGAGPVSCPFREEDVFFEDMPFGSYRFSLRQAGKEQGACRIEISEVGITVET